MKVFDKKWNSNQEREDRNWKQMETSKWISNWKLHKQDTKDVMKDNNTHSKDTKNILFQSESLAFLY